MSEDETARAGSGTPRPRAARAGPSRRAVSPRPAWWRSPTSCPGASCSRWRASTWTTSTAARRALEPAAAAGRCARAAAARARARHEDEPFHVQSDPLADLAENELERAFDHAESEPVEAWTTNRVAEAALHAVEGGAPEGVRARRARLAVRDRDRRQPATRSQGDPERARAIRRSLRGEAEGGAARARTSASAGWALSSAGSTTCGEHRDELRLDSGPGAERVSRRARCGVDGQRWRSDRAGRGVVTARICGDEVSLLGVEFGRILDEARKAADAASAGAIARARGAAPSASTCCSRRVDRETYLVLALAPGRQRGQGPLPDAAPPARDPRGAVGLHSATQQARLGNRDVSGGSSRERRLSWRHVRAAAHPGPARAEPEPAGHARARGLRAHHARGDRGRARGGREGERAPRCSASSRTTRAR